MCFMQNESVLQTKNRSEPTKKSVFCSPAHDIAPAIYGWASDWHASHDRVASYS